MSWYYVRPRNSREERERRELFQSKEFQEWWHGKFEEEETGERVSNCCCEKLNPDSLRCSKCNENCTPINI